MLLGRKIDIGLGELHQLRVLELMVFITYEILGVLESQQSHHLVAREETIWPLKEILGAFSSKHGPCLGKFGDDKVVEGKILEVGAVHHKKADNSHQVIVISDFEATLPV